MKASDFFSGGYSHHIAIVVFSTTDVDVPLNENTAQELVVRVATHLTNLFGGATAVPAQGFYKSNAGNVVIEQVSIVYTFCDSLANLDEVAAFVAELRQEFGQESVAIIVDGGLYFSE